MNAVTTPERVDDLPASMGQERIVLLDAEAGRAVIEYRAAMRMCHSGGVVQGGFIAGWLDAAMAHAAMAQGGMDISPMTLELKVSYFSPVGPGLVTAEGWVERRGRSTCFLEARLTNPAGEVMAKASSTCRLIARAKVEARTAAQQA